MSVACQQLHINEEYSVLLTSSGVQRLITSEQAVTIPLPPKTSHLQATYCHKIS